MEKILTLVVAAVAMVTALPASALDKDLARAISAYQIGIIRGITPDGLIINAKMLDTEIRIATAAKTVTDPAAAEVGRLTDSTAAVVDIWQSFKVGPCKGQVSLDEREKCVADLKRLAGLLPGFDLAKVSPSFAKEAEVISQALALLNSQAQRALEIVLK
ncbi:hypothetical protein [Azospirillum palustre]|nr:hypothetical protein [Azospirillum palustre]